MLGSGAGEKKPIKEVEMLCAHSTKLEGLNRATTEEALGVFNRFLEIANRHTEMSPLLREFVVEVQKLCSCSAIGIRLLDEEGNIPYEDYVGFSQNFYELESPLSIKSDKCMCINVIKGDTDPTLPFYTKGGSFYMNGTTKFLSHVTEEEKGQTRNVCNEIGYESVALVPIYYRERILGLIHIADHKENMVPLDIIEILEGVGMQLGTAMRRIQTEEALRASEERYRELFENAGEGIITLDLDGRITGANRLVEEYGFNRDDLIGRRLFDFVPEYDKARSVSDFQALVAGRRVQGQMDVITPKGIITVEYRDTPIVRAGEVIGVQAILTDITERKRAEEMLRREKDKAQKYLDVAGVMLVAIDAEQRVGLINKKGCDILGYKEEEILGKNWFENFLPERISGQVKAVFEKVIRAEVDASEYYENQILTKSGDERVIAWHSTVLRDVKGSVIATLSSGEDITERMKAEEALRESEEKFKSIFEHANDGVIYLDTSGNILDINEKAVQMFGGPKQQTVNKHFTEVGVFSADEIPTLMSNFERILSGEEVILTVPIKNKKGQELILECSASLAKTDDGAGRIMVIARDITERIKASEQIAKLAKFPAENPNPVLRISGRGTVIFANKAGSPLLKSWRCRVGESLPEPWHELVMDALSSGQSQQTEVQCDDRIFSLTFAPVVVANYVNVYGHDITERKKAEEMLLSERDRLISVFKAMEDGVYIVNQQHDIQYVNPVLEEDFGAWHNRKCYQYFHNREEVCPWCKNEEVFAGKTVRWEWYSFKNQKTYDLIDTPLKNLDGSISKLEIFRDISERKKTEEKLLEDQAKLKAMASEMLLTEEHERQRLAVGLHDEVCQKLVLTKLALESSLQLVSDSKVLASLRIACEGIGETIEQADSLTFELSNPVLRQLGFVIALEKYLTEEIRQKHGIEYELEGDEQLSTLPDEIKNCLFRVTRELLTNVVKHAQARKVKVSARESQSQIYVRVQDDGVGFKESQAGAKVSQTARFGLFSIREQLEYLGGHLEIESEPGRGTKATVVVPLRDKATV